MFKSTSLMTLESSIKFNLIIKFLPHLQLYQKPKSYQLLIIPAFLILESKSKMLWAILEDFQKNNFLTLSISSSKNSKKHPKISKRESKISDSLTDFTKNIKSHLKPFFMSYYLIDLHSNNFLHYFGYFSSMLKICTLRHRI